MIKFQIWDDKSDHLTDLNISLILNQVSDLVDYIFLLKLST